MIHETLVDHYKQRHNVDHVKNINPSFLVTSTSIEYETRIEMIRYQISDTFFQVSKIQF